MTTAWDRLLQERVAILGEKDGARYLELEERYRPGGEESLDDQEREEHNLLRFKAIARLNRRYGRQYND